MTISACCNRYCNALEMLGDEINRILEEMEIQFVAWQKERLFSGMNADGTDITPPYANLTIAIKKIKGQPTDRVTLLDTGDFYARIFARQIVDELIIDSEDWKSDGLKKKYGEKIFGLTEENKENSRAMTADAMVKYVKDYVGL